MAQNDQTDQAKPELVKSPRRLGKYELIARIGEGGMAEVFLARQTGPLGFQKVVVVKTIHPHLAREQEFIDMLLDEARVSALIKHPRVVDIYDLGVEEGTYFIAMEYIAGQPLSRVLGVAAKHKKKIDIYSTAQIIADAADGLHAAHNLESIGGQRLELVHRDVSPGNIMIQYTGTIKLLDFGVSKSLGRISTTSSGQLKGKLGYASPEQLDERPLDCRSDVWALGVVLWESLAFRRLYRQSSPAATIKKILEGDTPPPSKYRPEIPQELDSICMKAISIDVEDRFQTALEMRKAILEFLRSANYYGERERISTFMRLLFADRKRAEEALLKKVARAQSEIPVPLPANDELDEDGSAPSAVAEKKRAASDPEIEVLVGPGRAEDDEPEKAAGEKPEKSEKPAGSKQQPKPKERAKPAKSAKPDKPDKPDKPAKAEKPEKPEEPEVETIQAENEDPSLEGRDYDPLETAEIALEPMPKRWVWGAAAAAVAIVVLVIAFKFGGGGESETGNQQVVENTSPAIDAAVQVVDEADAAAVEDSVADAAPTHHVVPKNRVADAAVAPAMADAAVAATSAADAGAGTTDPDTALSPAEARAKAKRLYDEGTKAFVRGNLGRAKARFKKAADIANYAPAYRGLGLVYERQGRARSAVHYFRKYLRASGGASDAASIKKRIERLEKQ